VSAEQSPSDDPIFLAGIDLLRRTGQLQFQIRYSDDEEPVVWLAVGMWKGPTRKVVYDTAAALHPTKAVLRLCEQVMDGGQCQHCRRPSGFSEDFDAMPMNDLVCWYQYDPELKTFRRGCESTS
jgi:hypothetical protein